MNQVATQSSLAGRTALVTGASRGIGRAIALALGRCGATVAVHYNAAREQADEVVQAIGAAGGRAWALRADLAHPDGAGALARDLRASLREQTGDEGLDILVNNAGVSLRARLPEVSPQDFDRIIQVNLKTPFFLIQHLLPLLRDGGRIVNVSSMGTRAAYPEMSVYAPAKAGLEALTLLLASDLGARGITVNAVLPGATATDMNTRARDPAMADALARDIALGRVGQPEDIADIVAFLASDQARWITGQRIDATGGQRL
ncbi:SDR family oxidoreductase [Bordetella parapertussis]|uniref:SDR family oxidoreductase n=5 Tax=Bordetella TaxID=517 RepID=A0ABU5X8Y8_BORPP|nr:SDR family oxidoreductase [Bordetella parapertussis]AOB38793.1 short-chain dehydrogenase [Bordetella parapertussis]AUL42780.1 short-chain dehydrogenase [Bordetella parapertussis]AWP63701.1 short-chain dehydrogenase [Bordetella parapertussis]AWP71204.1 short-chain dehydrogenase [Bordetella parapertussis]AWP88781.1 short-chain dehydrogenase [Bordetella parapertussis]